MNVHCVHVTGQHFDINSKILAKCQLGIIYLLLSVNFYAKKLLPSAPAELYGWTLSAPGP